jgi:signal transduction histidine kinase
VSFWRQAHRTPAWWACAVLGPALITVDVTGQIQRGVAGIQTALFQFAMALATIAGLWIWAWRPATRMGPLMFWWPASWVAADLTVAFPDSRLVSTFGLVLFGMGPIVYAQMALSYPTGRLASRLAWAYVFLAGYLAQVIQNAYDVLYYDARGCPFCSPREPTYFHVGAPPFSLDSWNKGWAYEIIAVLPIGLYVLYRRYFTSGTGARRTMGPLVLAATVVTCTSWVQLIFIVMGDQSPLSNLSYVEDAGLIAVALASFLGLYFTRRARGPVGNLVVQLGRAGPGRVGEALARAVGDPSLTLALWLPERGVWVNEAGAEAALPEDPDRAVTFIGNKLAAIIHDPVFLDQPAMLEAAGAAARFALENERLQADLRSQLAELRESRSRIVRAGDDERRRLERDLHDGAQQRLLGIGMALQLIRSKLDGNEAARSLLDETETEMQAALAELRELARGIHPAVLTDNGLASAVRTLAERAPVFVDVSAVDERLPPDVETAAYFIVAEGLANIARYARASRAWVRIERRNGVLAIEVGDDGVGGAHLGAGSGLRGLADRAGALDGHLRVESEPGRGTRLLAEIPCAS